MLTKISITAAIIIICINIYLAGIYRGVFIDFNKYGIYSFDNYGVFSSITGIEFFFIAIFLLLFLISKIVSRRLISQLICLFMLLLTTFQYRQIYDFIVLSADEGDKYISLFNEAIPLNIISFSLIIILLILQIILFAQSLLVKNQK